MKPIIRKLGTIDCDLVETTPVVFRGRCYRFEYVRANYWANTTGDSYFRFVDHETGAPSAPFAKGYHLGNVMVDGDRIIVTGTNIWDGERVDLFVSTDMVSWQSWNVLNRPGYGIFNTSICKAADKYFLMYEVGKPEEVVGVRFTALFAESPDLKHWTLLPLECNYEKDRYTAPHAVRCHEGWYYVFYLESLPHGYEQYVVRSRDLKHWHKSPYNPVLVCSDDDRRLANPNLPEPLRQRVATARNLNNSDIDFCEFNGRVIINYSWGDQEGIEHLAEAVFDGTLAQFLTGWFDA